MLHLVVLTIKKVISQIPSSTLLNKMTIIEY